jgi:hypothetical protein
MLTINKTEGIFYFSTSRMNSAVVALTTLFVVLIVVVSIIALHFVHRQISRLGMIAAFTFIVGVILALCGAKKSEIIMGTFGYVSLKSVVKSTC